LKTVIIINVFTSVVVFVAGVFVLLMPSQNSSATVIFGIIMIAYSVYRFMNVISKQRLLKQEEKIEKLKIAQEEIIMNAKKQKEKNENVKQQI
jgi:Kef-type K+ transport system membrane component KefB